MDQQTLRNTQILFNTILMLIILGKYFWKALQKILIQNIKNIEKKINNSEIILFKATFYYYFFYEKLHKIINRIKKRKKIIIKNKKKRLAIKIFLIKHSLIVRYHLIIDYFLIEKSRLYANLVNNIIIIILNKLKKN
uniref:Uncharacterized protein n=1 Tax=Nitzschia sp. NIES-3576 TaxID=2083273 RepID=A0A2Z5ZBA7_9STRA|nr:hypothetical protein [Nitzschia sp. NIES-3576]